MRSDEYERLKLRFAELQSKMQSGLAGMRYFVDQNRNEVSANKEQINDLLQRVAKLEAHHDNLREAQRTGQFRIEQELAKKSSVRPPPLAATTNPKDAIEVLKTIGPWILGLIAIIATLVNVVTSR